ncbi:MAG: ferredoxin family protein [Desulfobacterales bacterium]|nr:ferredoxin family protein [Desulfobacterales bacterium]
MAKRKKLFTLKIDYERCDNCGICLFECGFDLFSYDIKKDRVIFRNPGQCVECFICEARCPEQAISLKIQ